MSRPNVPIYADEIMLSYLDGYILAMEDVLSDMDEVHDWELLMERVMDSLTSAKQTKRVVNRKLGRPLE
jgi:hypothetical protein